MELSEKYRFDERTQDILEHLTIPFAIYQYIDKRVVTIALSRGFCDEFGFTKLEDAYYAMDSDMYRATHPDDKTRVADAAYRFAAFDAPYDIVYRTRTLKDPDYIILHAYGRSIYPEPGVRLCLTWYAYEGHYSPEQGTYKSILSHTMNRFLTEESQYRGVYYDYLTGLPNMSYFYELAEAGRERMKEQNIDSAVLFFDLTDLKQFNYKYGFAEGDRLIRSVASVLAKHFSSENCAHFAKDNFAAFAPEEGLEECLVSVIKECAEINEGKTLPIRIGVYPDRCEHVEIGTACDRARLAADVRKKFKESYYVFFDMDMMAEEKNRQNIINDLDKAIGEGWIKVYYQPIVRSINGKICNGEALARWDDPVRGLLMPSQFIPVLEESMLIHKLDRCIIKQVIRDLRSLKDRGLKPLPVSINLSRADFDAGDLVRDICSMADGAQVDRNLICIEITESIVGSDFDYMKSQIEKLRASGFSVWMDDFGSGYSSLDVLQSIKFDLIKFDMSFMKRLDEGDDGKIILTEMMKMATSLGVDTICEGVETAEQVRFLQEIGCSKLQGYYFMKPAPLSEILETANSGKKTGFENPIESSYYETVGKLNLFDLSFLANIDDSEKKNVFYTVPMGIMEVEQSGDKVKYIRSNEAFRDFMKDAFGFDLNDADTEYIAPKDGPGSGFMKAIAQCIDDGSKRTFVDEKMNSGSVARSFIRLIGNNPVNGKYSVAIAVLSVKEPDLAKERLEALQKEREMLVRVMALSDGYLTLFTVDPKTGQYVEYSSSEDFDSLGAAKDGDDFFGQAYIDTFTYCYPEDRKRFQEQVTLENVMNEIRDHGQFSIDYRLIIKDVPRPVTLKAALFKEGDEEKLVIGVRPRE